MLSLYLSMLETPEQKDKLEFLYTTYYSIMVAVARKKVHDLEIAQDIVHDVILKVIRHIDEIDITDPLRTRSYLLTMVKNQAIDHLRHEKVIAADCLDDYAFVLQNDTPLPLELILQKDGYEKLISYIRQLSDTYRSACQLKYLNGMKEHEIAAALNISKKAANSRILRGRNILREMILKGENDGRKTNE